MYCEKCGETTVSKEDIGLMMVGDHINKGEEKAV